MAFNIDNIPKSYQRLFGPAPKQIEPWKDTVDFLTRPILPEIVRQRERQYIRWNSDVWNTWFLLEEEEKLKYKHQDKEEENELQLLRKQLQEQKNN